MATLIITRGLPGSGKTTKARAWVAENPARRARINRDDFRTMLHGGYLGTGDQEHQVTAARDTAVTELLRQGVDVVCDDTNLNEKHLDELWAVGRIAGADVEVWDLTDVPTEVCIERDAARPDTARVGEDVIRKMWRRYEESRSLPAGAYLDKDGDVCEIADSGAVYYPGRGDGIKQSAAGPFTRLVPEADTFPRELAQRLAVALDNKAGLVHSYVGHGFVGEWRSCSHSECADARILFDAASWTAPPKAVA